MYADGGGLYLQVTEAKGKVRKSWIFRYTMNGRAREMGLGSLDTWSLAEARDRAKECRQLKDRGVDPIAARDAEQSEKAAAAARALTFRQAAENHIDRHKASWRNPKHAAQWPATLKRYAYPTLGGVAVAAVDTEMVLKVLRPIWSEKPETAGRLRGRIEAVLDGAIASGARPGPNPARWKGHLENLLPKTSRVRRVVHHPAMPFEQVPGFMGDLEQQDGEAAKALRLVILTAVRTSEAIKAKAGEVDFSKRLWTIPADRVKNHKELRIPLTAEAAEILRPLCQGKAAGDWIFPGRRRSHMSDAAMLALLERMKRDDVTVHGFRSSFRVWAGERTSFGREIAEQCLGHIVGDQAERAYARTDLLEKRRQLLGAWAKFALTPPKAGGGDVVPIRAGA
jgi:integrase